MLGSRLYSGKECVWRVAGHIAEFIVILDSRCLVPGFDGVIFSREWKEALWDRYVMGAPRPRTPCEGFVAQIPAKDSLFEFSLLAGYDEQAKTHALPNDQLVLLQRSAEEAWVSDGVV